MASSSISDDHMNCVGLFPPGQVVPYGLVTAVFVLWGVANTFNHILIQQFMKLFALSRVQASALQRLLLRLCSAGNSCCFVHAALRI
jgi:FHS family L-fucose permease-like MFS transporter